MRLGEDFRPGPQVPGPLKLEIPRALEGQQKRHDQWRQEAGGLQEDGRQRLEEQFSVVPAPDLRDPARSGSGGGEDVDVTLRPAQPDMIADLHRQ